MEVYLMNMNVLIVIISLLFNMLAGGTTGNTTPANVQEITGFDPRFLQTMIMFGGNVDMNRGFTQEYDKTYCLDDSYQSYGWGKGSTVRIHGNYRDGFSFDFDIKATQHQENMTFDTPIDGVSIVTRQYTSGDAGYSFSVGPISLQTALQLFSYAASYMTPSNAAA